MNRLFFIKLLILVSALVLLLCGCTSSMPTAGSMSEISTTIEKNPNTSKESSKAVSSEAEQSSKTEQDEFVLDLSDIPEFSGEAFIVINDNIPTFSDSDLTTESYELYSKLDYLGRCGVAIASVGKDIMPTEERGSIGSVKPTGWHTVKYDNIDGKYLYNRCHLIGYQLTGENSNTQNLITGTRFMNIEGMLPFENMVADYIKETGNHVAYRITPVFEGENLLASGVQMEAYSVEDNGEGICFNIYCYNAQPDIEIDYSTGDSSYTEVPTESEEPSESEITYILNTNSKKFHYPSCTSAQKISDKNREETDKSREELIAIGYDPCGNCDP